MSSSSRRVVIVTGAAEGIGRSITLRLAEDGYDLGLFDLPSSQEKLEQLSATVRSGHGVRVFNVLGSVAEEADVRRLVAAVVQELGSLSAARLYTLHGIGPRLTRHFRWLPTLASPLTAFCTKVRLKP